MSLFSNKTLMITGGTGSFGNAVLNRFLKTDIGEIRIFRANGRLALCGSFSFYLVDAVIFYYVVPAFGGHV